MRALIDTPDKWTQAVLARNQNGERVEPHDPAATCFCLDGALVRVLYNQPNTLERDNAVYRALQAQLPSHLRSYINFNDATGTAHADVLTLIDKAVANAPA